MMRIAIGCTKVYINACSMNQGQAEFCGIAVDDQGSILRAWVVARDQILDLVAQTLLAIRYAQLEADKHGWKQI